MGLQPRERAVPCRYARRQDKRHTTININRVCDTCAELDREMAEARMEERYQRFLAKIAEVEVDA